eukprot:1074786-Pleurochrysis_carterae.AAC.1
MSKKSQTGKERCNADKATTAAIAAKGKDLAYKPKAAALSVDDEQRPAATSVRALDCAREGALRK